MKACKLCEILEHQQKLSGGFVNGNDDGDSSTKSHNHNINNNNNNNNSITNNNKLDGAYCNHGNRAISSGGGTSTEDNDDDANQTLPAINDKYNSAASFGMLPAYLKDMFLAAHLLRGNIIYAITLTHSNVTRGWNGIWA